MTTSIYTSTCKNRLLRTALEESEDSAGQNATKLTLYVYYMHVLNHQVPLYLGGLYD